MIVGNPIIVELDNHEYFEGPYRITPGLSEQTFPTAGTIMRDDIVVAPGSNDPYDGEYVIFKTTRR